MDSAIFYVQRRLQMMDYPHFRKRGYPIGSGNVESGHKVVVQRRMKGARMRWAQGKVRFLIGSWIATGGYPVDNIEAFFI